MDDKTKAQLCRKMIKDFWEKECGEPEELLVIVNAVYTVLEFEEDDD